MPKIVEIRKADDPRDVIHDVVQQLVEGKLVVLPTETMYVVAAYALHPEALKSLSKIAERMSAGSGVLAVKSAAEAWDYVGDPAQLADRFARRCWPGPVVLIFDKSASQNGSDLWKEVPPAARELVTGPRGLAARVSANEILNAALRLLPAPLICIGELVARGSQLGSAAQAAEFFADDVDLVIDDGPTRYNQPSSVVRITHDDWSIESEGVVTERTLARLAGRVFLFVCTGNTCRSPMAEALFRHMLTERLQCADEDLVDKGYVVASAGLAAGAGSPPSPEAVRILRDRGVDLNEHESQPVTSRLLNQADYIYTMTRQHRDAILREFPELAERLEVLSRDGSDIPDPIGFGMDEYEQCAEMIDKHLREILVGLS